MFSSCKKIPYQNLILPETNDCLIYYVQPHILEILVSFFTVAKL